MKGAPADNQDLADFLHEPENFDMQESVSDILKKFKEDQERIMNEGLMSAKNTQGLKKEKSGQGLQDQNQQEELDFEEYRRQLE